METQVRVKDVFPVVLDVFVLFLFHAQEDEGESDHQAKCYNLIYNEVKQLQ